MLINVSWPKKVEKKKKLKKGKKKSHPHLVMDMLLYILAMVSQIILLPVCKKSQKSLTIARFERVRQFWGPKLTVFENFTLTICMILKFYLISMAVSKN